MMQVCDVHDPVVADMITEVPLRQECDVSRFHFFHLSTATIKIWLTAKIRMV